MPNQNYGFSPSPLTYGDDDPTLKTIENQKSYLCIWW